MVLNLQDTLALFDSPWPAAARASAPDAEPLVIPYVELAVSMQCTLNCRDCCQLVPHYPRPRRMELNQTLAEARAFLEAVDHVIEFRIMGGEALLQPELPQLLSYILDHPRIQHLELVSNATLMPGPQLLEVLRHPKASVFFSNYGQQLSPRYQSIVERCLAAGLMVRAASADRTWIDYGALTLHTQEPEALRHIYRSCDMICKHIWHGELHVCPRSAHGRSLGLIPVRDADYVPLMSTTVTQRRRLIRSLYNLDYIAACGYCTYPCQHTIKAAIQVQKHPASCPSQQP